MHDGNSIAKMRRENQRTRKARCKHFASWRAVAQYPHCKNGSIAQILKVVKIMMCHCRKQKHHFWGALFQKQELSNPSFDYLFFWWAVRFEGYVEMRFWATWQIYSENSEAGASSPLCWGKGYLKQVHFFIECVDTQLWVVTILSSRKVARSRHPLSISFKARAMWEK